MYFKGRTLRALDAKSRIMLTPDFRSALCTADAAGVFVLTTRDGALAGYPLPLWEKIESAFAALRNPEREIRDFMRLFIGGAQEMTPDRHGRVLLSRGHLEYAGIEGEAWIVGVVSRFELWAPARFEAAISTDFSDISQRLGERGVDIAL